MIEIRILQVSPRFKPYIGGVENHVYYLSKELVKLGHDVTVVCANEPKRNSETIDGINVKPLPYLFKIANTNITPTIPFSLILKKADIIHSHIPTPWSADWSSLISEIKRTPLIITYHNDIVGQGINSIIAGLYNRTLLKLTLSLANRIIVTEPRYKKSIHLADYQEKLLVIPNGVDVDRFKPEKTKKRGPIIFFLGILDRAHRYKGVDYLIRAFFSVRKMMGNAKLVIGGSGELVDEYKGLCGELGISDSVEFAGFIREDKLVDYYNKCDVFVLPSIDKRQEGFGMVVLEAMSCNKPVVVTDVVGVSKDVRKHSLGAVVKPRDVDSLANGIIRVLKNKRAYANREFVEKHYNWKKIAKTVSDLYEELSQK